ncbi:hypothetical protein V6N11_023937 [Hibiscus sabdariffa]|uniref:Uncharacterized protein n=1 Tax=Hibiscus sabdariffa TaxID=183260 RepID=A0ABR2TNQ2_9ROSI
MSRMERLSIFAMDIANSHSRSSSLFIHTKTAKVGINYYRLLKSRGTNLMQSLQIGPLELMVQTKKRELNWNHGWVILSCLDFSGLDEACISGKKGSCRRNDKCLTSTEVRGSTSEGNSFELPEFQDMFKEFRIKKKRYGSLSAIQGKGISEADKRMRVRAKK